MSTIEKMRYRNPPWKFEELILALNIYHQSPRPKYPDDPRVIEVSSKLRDMPSYPSEVRKRPDFRSPNSVALKLSNFLYLDPNLDGGSPHVSAKDREVFKQYYGRFELVAELASKISEEIVFSKRENIVDLDDLNHEGIEGAIIYLQHWKRERNQNLIRKKKKVVLDKTGKLQCEVCQFDFFNFYGERGHGFIECHHIVPISKCKGMQKTKLSDLAVVCSNCHRMLHRLPEISISELRKEIGK